MRTYIKFLFAALIALSLTACGGSSSNDRPKREGNKITLLATDAGGDYEWKLEINKKYTYTEINNTNVASVFELAVWAEELTIYERSDNSVFPGRQFSAGNWYEEIFFLKPGETAKVVFSIAQNQWVKISLSEIATELILNTTQKYRVGDSAWWINWDNYEELTAHVVMVPALGSVKADISGIDAYVKLFHMDNRKEFKHIDLDTYCYQDNAVYPDCTFLGESLVFSNPTNKPWYFLMAVGTYSGSEYELKFM